MVKDEAKSLNIVQGIMLKSKDVLRRIIAPGGGEGGVTPSYLCPHCNSVLLEDYMWERCTAVGGAQSVEINVNGERPTVY